jgi:homoserine O-succinyltransferase
MLLIDDGPHAGGRVRIGIVDLMATTAGGVMGDRFGALLRAGLSHGRHGAQFADFVRIDLDPTADPSRPTGTDQNWELVATCDALVVTGAEPRTANFHADACFRLVERLLMVAASGRPVSILFSCLSAHAALDSLHSALRHPMPHKVFGLAEHERVDDAAGLLAGMPQRVLLMPHSRWHTVPRSALEAAGVVPVLAIDAADWGLATSADGLRYVFLQGHPEYSSDTLLREYRRDVSRYLRGESARYPTVPTDYLDPAAVEVLEDFAWRAQRLHSRPSVEHIPDVLVDPSLAASWAGWAEVFVGNWADRVFELVDA